MTYALGDFVHDLDRLVESGCQDPMKTAREARPMLEELISDGGWCATANLTLPETEVRRLLYRHPAGAYTVSAMVFGPGSTTPVHDHDTWGLVGVWQGEEREERFGRPGNAPLTLDQTTINRTGTVTMLVPPAEDIHRITNRTQGPAYSIHVYGAPSTGRGAQAYDLVTGAVARWEDDPIGAVQAWGGRIGLRTLVAKPEATDEDLLRLLRRRVGEARRAVGPKPKRRPLKHPRG